MGILLALIFGLAAGFAGGFFVGKQGVSIPAPHAAAEPVPIATASVTAPEPEHTYTDAAVVDAPPQPAPLVEPAVETVVPAGSLIIASRPDGAQVFVDGRRAGTTPMSTNVQPGPHRVRIELNGHRRWETMVDVAGGTNVRVGASLTEN